MKTYWDLFFAFESLWSLEDGDRGQVDRFIALDLEGPGFQSLIGNVSVREQNVKSFRRQPEFGIIIWLDLKKKLLINFLDDTPLSTDLLAKLQQ